MPRILATAALLAAVAGPLAAAPTPEEIEAGLAEGLDHLVAARRLLAGEEPTAAERAQARELFQQAVDRYADVLEGVERTDLREDVAADVEALAHYNSACAYARLGDLDRGLRHFGAALEHGYADFDLILEDSDLDVLREEPRFAQILERTRARYARERREAARPALSDSAVFDYDLVATTIDGEELRLDDLRGKVVIVDYWGTWCPPCRQEIPHFVALKDALGDQFEVIGLTWERGNRGPAAVAGVRRFAEQVGIDYPLVMATQEHIQAVPDLRGYPTTLFVDKRGRVRSVEVGYRDLATIRGLVEALLEEPDPPEDGAEPVGPF